MKGVQSEKTKHHMEGPVAQEGKWGAMDVESSWNGVRGPGAWMSYNWKGPVDLCLAGSRQTWKLLYKHSTAGRKLP